MSTLNNIQNALNAKLSSLSGLPSIAWPNMPFEPTQASNYIRPTLLPANSTLYTLNEGDYHSGIYQVDVFVKLKNGTAEALLLADIIRDGFRRQSLTNNSTVVHVQSISMSQAERVESFWRVFVDINYISIA